MMGGNSHRLPWGSQLGQHRIPTPVMPGQVDHAARDSKQLGSKVWPLTSSRVEISQNRDHLKRTTAVIFLSHVCL